jgi:hypothetical protein
MVVCKQHCTQSILKRNGFLGYSTKYLNSTFLSSVWCWLVLNGTHYRYWKDVNNVREYLEWLKEMLGLKHFEDWYNVTSRQLCRMRGAGLLHSGGLYHVLSKYTFTVTSLDSKFCVKYSCRCYPEYPWDRKRFSSSSKSQLILLQGVKHFTKEGTEIHINYKHPKLKFKDTKVNNQSTLFTDVSFQKSMEFDIFIPSLSLAFEYQGHHHFEDMLFGEVAAFKEKDSEKMNACKEAGFK